MILKPIAFHPAMIRLKRIVAGMPDTERRELISNLKRGERPMSDVNETIIELIRKHGRKRTLIAQELNAMGIKTSKGNQWTGNNLGMLLKRHGLYALAEAATSSFPTDYQSTEPTVTTELPYGYQSTKMEQDIMLPTNDLPIDYQGSHLSADRQITNELPGNYPVMATDYQEITDRLPEPFTFNEVENLRRILEMYETGELCRHTELPTRRPLFTGPRINSGIVLSKTIRDLAEAKRKAEVEKVGSSFSLLVEYLLWMYIGKPANVVSGAHETRESDASDVPTA